MPPLLWLAQAVIPRLYVGYLWFVWKTSRVEDCGYPSLSYEIIERGDGLIAMLWHEEVFSVAWSYRTTRPHTLANVGDSGEHGLGCGNREYAALEHGESLALMKQIKAIFDPHGILNPGKIWE